MLYRLHDEGEIIELSRGVFRRADAPAASWPDLLAVQVRSPVAIACCLTAASVHGLTDELPGKVQIAVPRGTRTPQIAYPPTQALRFDAPTFELGLSQVEAAPGESVRVYDPSRTVVDLFRLRHRFGEAAAYGVLR
ncbi:MAG: type IV toxin-antitoxin system AbiEi family antitoxin [Truepera sp.]|nr:type IV toxin-antitoxin system AbiEi family antitoxin [Truepera sp.]